MSGEVKISELIAELKKVQDQHGDIDAYRNDDGEVMAIEFVNYESKKMYSGFRPWVANVSLCRQHLARINKAADEGVTDLKRSKLSVPRRSPFRGITDSQGTRPKTTISIKEGGELNGEGTKDADEGHVWQEGQEGLLR